MESVSLRIAPRQLRRLLTRTVSVAAVAAVLITLWMVNMRNGALLAPWAVGAAVGALVCAYAYLACRTAFTECTQSGIRTRGLAGPRACSWAEVRAITPLQGGMVRISTSYGRHFWLGAPVHSRLMDDPEFFAKVMQIKDCWRSAAERPASLS